MRLGNEKGGAAVEFAVVLPLLVLILFGIVEYGFIFYNKQVLTNASREGARFGIVSGSPRASETQIKNEINTYISQKLVSFSSTETLPVIKVCSMDKDSPGTEICPNATNSGPLDYLSVRVDYPYQFLLLPNLGKLFSSDARSNILTLSATTVMRYE